MNINATLIGQSVAFLVFVWFCMQYVWPPIIQALNERKQKIADGLAASEQADQGLKLARRKAEEQMRTARSDAQVIVERAGKQAGQIIDEAKETARQEGERIKQAAHAEIEQNVKRAREQLKSDVAALVLTGAEQVLKEKIDQSVDKKMIDKLIADL